MRVVELQTRTNAFARRMRAHANEVSQLRSATIAETSMGGYLVLHPRRRSPRRPSNLIAPLLAMGRARTSGLACMTLAGVVALFAVSGPVGCRCNADLVRLAYARDVPLAAPAVSLITTSAINVATLPAPHPAQRSRLLPSKITPLPAATPVRIHLAAAEPIVGTDAAGRWNVAMLTAIEVKTSQPREAVAIDSGKGSKVAGYVAIADEAAPKPSGHARRHKRHRTASSATPRGRRAPGWARQMYDNNWQGTAFSYVR
jgi:hypothetical protein